MLTLSLSFFIVSEMVLIKLLCSDGEIIEADQQILVQCSRIIRRFFENMPHFDPCRHVVPLDFVSSAILRKVLQWAYFHQADPRTADDDGFSIRHPVDISAGDAEFLNVDIETLHELAVIADDLGINALLDVTYQAIVNLRVAEN